MTHTDTDRAADRRNATRLDGPVEIVDPTTGRPGIVMDVRGGVPSLTLLRPDGSPWLQLGGASGTSAVRLYAPSGVVVAELGLSPVDDLPSFVLSGQDGAPRATVEALPNGGNVALWSPDADAPDGLRVGAELRADGWGGELLLSHGQGAPPVVLHPKP